MAARSSCYPSGYKSRQVPGLRGVRANRGSVYVAYQLELSNWLKNSEMAFQQFSIELEAPRCTRCTRCTFLTKRFAIQREASFGLRECRRQLFCAGHFRFLFRFFDPEGWWGELIHSSTKP